MDFSTVLGLVIGIGGIILGNIMEGGHVSSLVQLAAAFIVFGGTMGATMVSSPIKDLVLGLKLLKLGFGKDDENEIIRTSIQIVEAAKLARKESILALEAFVDTYPTEFMRNAFKFVIDGVEHSVIREVFESEIDEEEEKLLAGANIWMEAGGYAPTIGIIGAVLGLIHVMGNLTNTSALGQGIAVAFVATIYGVGSANLFFIPFANKLKRKIKKKSQIKQMILEGALGISKGQSPYIIDEKMKAYTGESTGEFNI